MRAWLHYWSRVGLITGLLLLHSSPPLEWMHERAALEGTAAVVLA